jgi:hypothetical protein
MSENKAVGVTALRAVRYSTDGKSVVVTVETGYSSVKQKCLVPVECFYDLVLDL